MVTKKNIYDENDRLPLEEVKRQLAPTLKVIASARNLNEKERDILRALVMYAATNDYQDLLLFEKDQILRVLKENEGLVEQARFMYNNYSKKAPFIQVLNLLEAHKESKLASASYALASLDKFVILEMMDSLSE